MFRFSGIAYKRKRWVVLHAVKVKKALGVVGREVVAARVAVTE